MAKANASANGNQYAPCGVATPRKSITGKCQADHSTPSRIAAPKALLRADNFGNANPIQPISSKIPAGMPKAIPIQNRFDANAGDTKVFKHHKTLSIRHGAISNVKYQPAGNPARSMRENTSRNPFLPSTTRVRSSPATLGPSNIAGNIISPANLGTDS